MTDAELNCAYEDFLTTVTAGEKTATASEVTGKEDQPCLFVTAAAVRSKLRRFDQLEDSQISESITASWTLHNKRLNYGNTGCWCLFYDWINFDQAWAKITQLYQSKELVGVLKLARANNTYLRSPNENSSGCPILAFTGPCEEKEYVMQVGIGLLKLMKFTRQRCSKNYPQNIYFKRTKRALLYENGPKNYALPY